MHGLKLAKSYGRIKIRLLYTLILGTSIIMDNLLIVLILICRLFIIDMRCQVVVEALLVEILSCLGIGFGTVHVCRRFVLVEVKILYMDRFRFEANTIDVDH